MAAGKGTRMQCQDKNKVAMLLGNKPLVLRIVHLLKTLDLGAIVAVVGYAKESVIEALAGENVLTVEQTEQLGTAHAVQVGLKKLPEKISDVIVIYGDDASLYPASLLNTLVIKHMGSNAAVTFITFTVSEPKGLGRVLRDENGNVSEIVEEKNATEEQKKVNEINSGCYIFNKAFLAKYLPRIGKNPVSGEYYLTDIIELALKNNEKVETVEGKNFPWRGINTPDELKAAEKQISL